MHQSIPEDLSPAKRALIEIRELRAKVAALESAKREPLAVVGIGCRVPGASGPRQFFEMLLRGTDAIGEVPAARWSNEAFYNPDPDAPGAISTRWGGFVEGIDLFEPQLFGVSPREASAMDPQQRLLLEVAWEALEHAGYAPDRLRGTDAGVFVGIGTSDYAQLQIRGGNPASIDTYYATGSVSHSVASGRLAYFLGAHGPAISVDTACSSSLVAIHLACQSLRARECSMALAGGVNAILAPENSISLSRAHMMARDGRCKTFDARADGFVRGEGAGIVVLKRLTDAVADGDRILAVVRGSAVNQDGRSNGLTAPNGPSQEAVIRSALANAGIDAGQVGYIETHGTGTELGDPIELQALGAVVGRGRSPDRPVLIGSVKTNVGHLETAAGVTGFIKVVLALQHETVPAHLNFVTPTPHVDWDHLGLCVVTEPTRWEPIEGKRIGGVSSFGFSGTNAHVLLEGAPAFSESPRVARSAHLLCISARTETALRATAKRWAQFLDAETAPVADLCFTAAVGRARLPYRAAVVVDSTSTAIEALQDIADGAARQDVRSGHVEGADDKPVVFLFTGQGSQYPGMGRTLFETEPVFAAAVERCDVVLRGVGLEILPVLFGDDPSDRRIHDTAWTQPALFTLQYALAELWRAQDVTPSAVLGHSAGEYAAACVAGIVPLADALRLLVERARLMQSAPGRGAMAAVHAPEAAVSALLAEVGGIVAIAAVNAPSNTVVSGEDRAVAAVMAAAERRGIRSDRLQVSHAFHSPLMDPVLREFERVAGDISTARGDLPLVSNLTGRFIETPPDARYWTQHLRQPVRYADGIRTLLEAGYRTFVEVGPQPTLCALGKQAELGADAVWIPSLTSKRNESEQMLDAAAQLLINGVTVNWSNLDHGRGMRRIALPTYPFERKRFWFEATTTGKMRTPALESKSAAAEPVSAEAAIVSTEPAAPAEKNAADAFAARVLAAFQDERRQLLESYVAGHVRDVLQMDESEPLDAQQGLLDTGLDSLMAVELRTRLESGLKLPRALPATLVFDCPTISSIAAFLTHELERTTAESADAFRGESESSSEMHTLDAGAIEALSDEEAEALLLRRLASLGEST